MPHDVTYWRASEGVIVGVRIGDQHLDLLRTSFGCDDATARVIAGRAQERRFDARSPIIIAGARTHDAWLVLEGQAQAVAYSPSGQYVLLHGFVPGDLFGDAAGLLTATDDTEVSTVSATTAGHFRQMEFLALMENHTCVALTVARQLTGRLSETTRRMVQVATLSVTGRIHTELLRRARQFEDLTIRPAPILSEFALQVQSTRETVSRAISQLEKRGIILRNNDGLKIVAPHRLEEMIA